MTTQNNRVNIQVTESGTTLTGKKIAGLGATAQASSMQFNKLATAVAGMVAAYAGFRTIASTISVIRDFDTKMLEVSAVTLATAEDMKRLTLAARQMGEATRYSATEAGDALLSLSRNGFTVNQALTALPETLNIAIAGVLSLQEAADIASITVKQFAMDAGEVGRIGDVFIRTANTSAQTVQDMAESMKYAGVVAGTMGKSLEETAGAIGVLANSGLRGSMAGTSLRRVLLALTAPTDSALQALADLGLTIKDVDTETMSLTQVFTRLRDAGMGATEANQIFGRTGVAGALILSKYAENLDAMTKANEEAAGVAKKTADMMDSGLNAKLLILKSVIEEVMLKLGDAGLKKSFTDIVLAMTDAIKIVFGWSGALKQASTMAKVFAGVISAVFGVGMIMLIKNLSLAIYGMVLAIGKAFATNPFTAWFVVIGAVIGILYAFRDQIITIGKDTFRLKDIFYGLWYSIKTVFSNLWNVVKNFAISVWDSMKQLAKAVWTALTPFGDSIAVFFKNVFGIGQKQIDEFAESISNFEIDWSPFKQFVNDMINAPIAIVRAFAVAFKQIVILISEFMSDLTRFGTELGKRLVTWNDNIGKFNHALEIFQVGVVKGWSPSKIWEEYNKALEAVDWSYPEDELNNARIEMGKRLGKNIALIQSEATKQLQEQMGVDLVGNTIAGVVKFGQMLRANIKKSFKENKDEIVVPFMAGDDLNLKPQEDWSVFDKDSLIGDDVKEKTLQDLKDISEGAQAIFDAFSQNISSTLGDFLTGMEVSWKNFIKSLTDDIIRAMTDMLVNQLFAKLSQGLLAMGSAKVGDSWGGFNTDTSKGGWETAGDMLEGLWSLGGKLGMFAFGGKFDAGVPRLMNEYGKGEIDVPSYSGRVLSKQDAMKSVQKSEPIALTILNDLDDNRILQAFNTKKGQRLILNTISSSGAY